MAQLNIPAETGNELSLSLSLGKIAAKQGAAEIPILSVFKEGYLLWHNYLTHLPRLTRYTLGIKIDNLFTDLIAATLTAQYAKREQKLILLLQLAQKLDHLKYFTTILWETKGLKTNEYSQLAQKFSGAGVMLGGWIRKLESAQKETPPM